MDRITLYLCILILGAAIHGCRAVEYSVNNTAANTPGGARFNQVIGEECAKHVLDAAANFIWRVFRQNSPGDRKDVKKVIMFVDDMDGVAYEDDNEIHVSARYINSYSGDVKVEITGVLYHESTHIWQWDGNGTANQGLIEGIADFVRLKAGYAPSHWRKPGAGGQWDAGYDITAFFLDYCNDLKNGFVAELNKKMKYGTAIHGCRAVEYTVTNTAANTPGGARFNQAIGEKYSKQVLGAAANFIWRVFQQKSAGDRKGVQKVSMFVDDMDGVAYASNNEIHVSARYINGYSGDVKREITGVLYHESTHIWQWNGNGAANGGLIEGIADYVRLKAGYAPSHWRKPGEGDRWDAGYDVTARFLDYCNDLKNGFVAELNKKMKDGYSDSYFSDILGKTVDQLWTDYKAKYNTN
nr:Basic secretory protease [Ipomoea batatas]